MYQETLTTAERISLHDSYKQLGNSVLRQSVISIPDKVPYDSQHLFLTGEPVDVTITSADELVTLSLRQQDGPASISHDYVFPCDQDSHGMVHERREFGPYDYQAGQDVIRAERYALLDHIRSELAARLVSLEANVDAPELAGAHA
jgi:hypothetical protein